MTIVICQECNDAPAVTRRRFNGPETALYDVCQDCADDWDADNPEPIPCPNHTMQEGSHHSPECHYYDPEITECPHEVPMDLWCEICQGEPF